MFIKKSQKTKRQSLKQNKKQRKFMLNKRGGRPAIDVDIVLDNLYKWFWPVNKEQNADMPPPQQLMSPPANMIHIPVELLTCIQIYNDLYRERLPQNAQECYELYRNWIMSMYFERKSEWFKLFKYMKIIDQQTVNFRWHESSLIPFLYVYNNIFITFFLKIVMLVSNRYKINMDTVNLDQFENSFNDDYIIFIFNKFGCAGASPGVLNIIQQLFSNDVSDCGIFKKDEYYSNYKDSVGKGGFGAVFNCANPSKIVKFIESPNISKGGGGSTYPGIDQIMVIIKFLNEIIINLELNLVNPILFKRLHSFGYKRIPDDLIRNLIDQYENSPDPDMTPEEMPIHGGRFYMVMDNMGATLGNKLKQKISLDMKLNYMRNLVDGLFIMHDNSFCHLDIKENNILIGNDNVARFIDFGMSNSITNPYVKWSGSTEGWYPKISGLYAFTGYQLLNIDIYHLGLIFYFILLNDGDLIEKVNDFFENKSNATSDDFYNYLNSLVYDMLKQHVEYTYIYNKIIQFIKNNHMLDFEVLNIAGPGRMRQIRDNFHLKFPNAD